MSKVDRNIPQYLLENAGPIIRWRVVQDLPGGDDGVNKPQLLAEVLSCPEVQRWLDLLGRGQVHGSEDVAVENALAKLCEYGLHAGLPGLDERVLPYCAIGDRECYQEDALVLAPFLVRLGYGGEPRITHWMEQRIEVLYELACQRDYDLYRNVAEHSQLPPSQQTLHGHPKLFYKPRFARHWNELRIPTCYDLYALAYFPKADLAVRQKIETIVTYILEPSFQETPGGYVWHPQLRRAYSAGRVFLACLPRPEERGKLVLFLEILAQFACGQGSEWFQQGLAQLETFRLESGAYCFPRQYLSEKSSYYLYAGAHMGLGERPRDRRALELESTFRMVRLKSLANLL